MKALSGLKVLMLRSSRPNDPLTELLSKAGATVECCPVLIISGLQINSKLASMRYDKVIFVSRHAVSYGLQALLLAGMDFSSSVVMAVGPTTATALREFGIDARHPVTQASTEGLLELPEMAGVAGQKILIVRGRGGREVLKDSLLERGAEVSYCEAYCRVADSSYLEAIGSFFDPHELTTETAKTRAVMVHSGEIAVAYASLLNSVPASARRLAWELPCITPGARVADAVRALGFRQVITASSAVAGDMEQALRYWYTGANR